MCFATVVMPCVCLNSVHFAALLYFGMNIINC